MAPKSVSSSGSPPPVDPPVEGVYFAYALDRAGGAEMLDPAGLRAWRPEQGLLWALLDRHDQGAEAWLDGVFGLPEVVREGLLASDTRPRCARVGEGLLIILRGVNLNPGATPDDMVSVRMWVDSEKVVCLRGQRVYALADLKDRIAAGLGARDAGDIVAQIADALADRIRDVVANQQDLVDEIDEASMERVSPDLRKRLQVPRRQAMTIRRYMAPQRDLVSRLVSEPGEFFDERDRMRLREIADELTRLVEELDLLRERSSLIQEQMSATASEQMNRTMYVLSLVAAVFLPLGLITGLLGVNVGGIPGVDSPWAFWVVTGGMAVLAVIQWWLFKRMRLF